MFIQPINTPQNYMLNKKFATSLKETPVKDTPVNNIPAPVEQQGSENVNFKGGLGDFIGKLFGENYAKRMLDADWTHALAKKMSTVRGSMTEHMATAGSFITSSVYMARTLTNKELDNDKKQTLAINQFLCFLVPTICAYTVNYMLAGFNKELEHGYADLQRSKLATGTLSAKEAANLKKLTSDRLKGFKTLASLATFTLIYRYVTPVVITPVANWIGSKLNQKKDDAETKTVKA